MTRLRQGSEWQTVCLGFLNLFKALSITDGLYPQEREIDFKQLNSLERLERSEQMCKAQ